MARSQTIDIGTAIDKLIEAGVTKKSYFGFEGDFIINEHSMYLTPAELENWLFALHLATPHAEQGVCSDTVIHRFKFQFQD